MKLGLVVVLSLVHVMQGCHTWQVGNGKTLPPTSTLTVKAGTRVRIEIRCPMDFMVNGQLWHTGTAHTLTFRKRGVYVYTATNVQTPEEVGLQVMGPVNTPKLIVRVR